MSVHTKLASYIAYLLSDQPHHLADQPVLLLLAALSRLYQRGVLYRYHSFSRHPDRQVRLAVPVISLGNITAGGTGKTPTACLLASWLQQQGYKTALLNRGYRSAAEKGAAVMSDGEHILLDAQQGGDEALLLARSLPGVPVLVGRQRAQTGQMAIQLFGVQVLLLDDAFQHWQLARNLDIVLIDGTNPFGNGHVLPRGILREPLLQLDRADFFLITKADLCSREEKDKIYTVLRRYNAQAPIAEAVHQPAWCIRFDDWYNGRGRRQDYPQLGQQTRVAAISALGNPASFEATVRECGYVLCDSLRYGDHHQYTEEEIAAAAAEAQKRQAVLVTTEKDAVKLPARQVIENKVPVWVLGIEIKITKGKKELQEALLQCVHRGG